MKTQTTTNPVAIRLIQDLIERIPIYESGTYNRMDPTHFEKGEATFNVFGQEFNIRTNDCTWGVEIEICIIKQVSYERLLEMRESGLKVSRKGAWSFHENGNVIYHHLISNFYLSGFGSKYDPYELIIRKKQKGIYKVLFEINRTYTPIHTRDEQDVWIDPAGGTHYGYEDDPARMYE